MIGLIIYKSGDEYFCNYELGKIPKPLPGSEVIFSHKLNYLGKPKSELHDLFLMAKQELQRRGIELAEIQGCQGLNEIK